MHTNDLWLLTVLLWLSWSWLSAYLISGLTAATRLTIMNLLTSRTEEDCPNC